MAGNQRLARIVTPTPQKQTLLTELTADYLQHIKLNDVQLANILLLARISPFERAD